MKKEKPILFSTDMVKAILAGRKTQTRRVVKPQPDQDGLWNHTARPMSIDPNYDMEGWWGTVNETGEMLQYKCPYADIDHINLLWVRETFCRVKDQVAYKSDYSLVPTFLRAMSWKPSIHMPKDAARIWLEITEIRVERLQDISEEDAIAEGINEWPQPKLWDCYQCEKGHKGMANLCEDGSFSNPIDSFRSLWESINDKSTKNWTSNPWVWVISFKVLSTTGKPKTERGAGDDYPVIEAYHTAKKVCQ